MPEIQSGLRAHAVVGVTLVSLLLPTAPIPGSIASAVAGACPWDCGDGDGTVGVVDFLALLADWGNTSDCDFDGGGVSVTDVLEMLANWGPCPEAVSATQLAGNSLSSYPFFEYVRAFNENATVELAVDPGLLPSIVGKTCDLYVVQAKTETQWASDPSLTDASGGVETATFVAGTIQSNTYTVADPFELDADAGLGFGVGYDVICDCDQDGQLSGADYIDGLSDEAGMYAIHDTAAPGPLDVTEIVYDVGTVFGIPAGRTFEDLYYPTDIGSMGQLPLVIVSHGNGHQYTWYGHIGDHLASYGYIVMSHQNNTEPGIESASSTTLGHTDAIIDQQDTIGGGVLDGHIDSNRIMWIGHSRGGEGIVRAYDRIFDGTYTPTHYVRDDIVLLSSMAPTDFLGTSSANPHDANYHLWTASGDADVSGEPGCEPCQTYHLYERATGWRQSTTVQGIGHGDFHDGFGSVFSGPCHITPKERVHDILQGYFLPLINFYVEGNIPAKDFLWRQWEHFKPIGAPEGPPCGASGGGDSVVVNNELRRPNGNGIFVIDDYQHGPSTGTSSSGGTVTFNVSNVSEGLLRDGDGTFVWNGEAMNGMTRARPTDFTMGVVFDWTTGGFYEQEVVPAGSDFAQYTYLQFRACQQTRHPHTTAALGDLTFTVTLRDGSGTSSSVNISAYGGGIEEPYQRGGGWGNEFETIRIRLTDFLHNGSGLDLGDIAAIRFEFGNLSGSRPGRIGLDDIVVVDDTPPPPPGG
ncbi:MAG: poly(ethylene terephthalate) hydrolase family protein [Planctomycetota bacterium]|jgi:hypothetical protein